MKDREFTDKQCRALAQQGLDHARYWLEKLNEIVSSEHRIEVKGLLHETESLKKSIGTLR